MPNIRSSTSQRLVNKLPCRPLWWYLYDFRGNPDNKNISKGGLSILPMARSFHAILLARIAQMPEKLQYKSRDCGKVCNMSILLHPFMACSNGRSTRIGWI